jgi:fatty-acyl-CoA synthase
MEGLMMQYLLTVPSILDHGNRVFPHKEIISILPDKTRHQYTYADLYKRSKQLRSALTHKLKVKKGDFIGTFAWNHYQHLELYYGIPGAGAICHTINIRLSSAQTEYIINNAEDRYLFVDASLVALLEPIVSLLPSVEAFILLNAPKGFTTKLPNCIDYEELIAGEPDDEDWVAVEETEACAMCYTSGTTGQPKGVLYSHRSTFLHALVFSLPNYANLSFNDRLLVVVPQFHVMAWGMPFGAILNGTSMVMPSAHLQPDALIQIMIEEKVDRANGVPTIWQGIYASLKKTGKPSGLILKDFFVGGATMPPKLMDQLEKEFGIKALHAWGMTETSPVGTFSKLQPEHQSLSDAEQLGIRSKQGQELPCIELRAVLEDGSIAPRDGKTAGEIHIKGAWVIGNYYKENNRDSFTQDGWFKTGDVGILTPDGFLHITDRAKDLIKSGGEWISSVALEVAIMAIPKIKEAAVIAIPDEVWTERPLAVIVPIDDNDKPSYEEMIKMLSPNFAKYQLPEKFVFIKEIPKTSVGKFDKKEMRRLYAAGLL